MPKTLMKKNGAESDAKDNLPFITTTLYTQQWNTVIIMFLATTGRYSTNKGTSHLV
jgi:hypothetical protein